MDGVHDLGGMHGFGPVEREENEPVFHAPWEAVVVAINEAARRRPFYNIDEFRHSIERMAPADYLASSYYERWLDSISRLLIEKGVVTADELDARVPRFRDQPNAPVTAQHSAHSPPARASANPDPPSLAGPRGGDGGDPSSQARVGGVGAPAEPPARPQVSPQPPAGYRRPATVPPRFSPGDRVLTRNVHPKGHTRLPRYARGKRGVIDRVHGVFVFADTHAHGQGEHPQPVYSVRFDARELWGESAEPHQQVHVDLWESYLIRDA